MLEALGGPAERIRATGRRFDLPDIQPLNLLAIEVAGPAPPPSPGLPDALFEHDGQLTRREIRAVTLSALAPRRGELLWDVGGGAGSIGIEWMLRHPANRAIAIEPEPTAPPASARNAAALGVPGAAVVAGRRPGRAGRPAAARRRVPRRRRAPARRDRRRLGRAAPGGRLVANAVTMETEAAARRRRPGSAARCCGIGVERLDRWARCTPSAPR